MGTGHLTFLNFRKAVVSLTASSAPKDEKGRNANRTVFRFYHSFVIDGVVCIPPIGGAHPEHASSRFNLERILAFLEHGGAHPFFFRLIK